MAILYTFTSSDNRTLVITDGYTVSDREEYISSSSFNIKFSGYEEYYWTPSGTTTHYTFVDEWIGTAAGVNTSVNMRNALYLDQLQTPSATVLRFCGPNNEFNVNALGYLRTGTSQNNIPGDFNISTSNAPSMYAEVAVNIPIFSTYQEAQDYVTNGGHYIQHAINYKYSPILDSYDYVSSTKTVHETLTDRYTCGESEEYKTNPIFWCKGRISVRGNGGNINYGCDLQHPYGTDRAAFVIAKTYSNFMGSYRYADRSTVLLNALVTWDSGSTQIAVQGENFDGLVYPYTNATLEVATNIPVFSSNDLAYAYVRANTQEEARQAIRQALNYRVEYPEVVGDKLTSAQLNLLRRRLLNKVRNNAST